MRRISTVFLAGPDVFFPEAPDLFARKHALCTAAGFAPLTADDADIIEEEQTEAMAREIYAAAVAPAAVGGELPADEVEHARAVLGVLLHGHVHVGQHRLAQSGGEARLESGPGIAAGAAPGREVGDQGVGAAQARHGGGVDLAGHGLGRLVLHQVGVVGGERREARRLAERMLAREQVAGVGEEDVGPGQEHAGDAAHAISAPARRRRRPRRRRAAPPASRPARAREGPGGPRTAPAPAGRRRSPPA